MGKCTHDGVKHAFNIGDVKVFGSSKSDLDNGWLEAEPALIISLLGKHRAKSLLDDKHGVVNDKKDVLKRVRNYKPADDIPVLWLDWGDRKSPPLPDNFFKNLVQDLKELDGNVIVHCQGGHGRTGTLLSVLAHHGKAFDKGTDVPEKIREVYCEKAIESIAQVNWLNDNKIYTKIKPSKSVSGRTVYVSGSKSTQSNKGSKNKTSGNKKTSNKDSTSNKDPPSKRYGKCDDCGTYSQLQGSTCISKKNCEQNKLPHWSET